MVNYVALEKENNLFSTPIARAIGIVFDLKEEDIINYSRLQKEHPFLNDHNAIPHICEDKESIITAYAVSAALQCEMSVSGTNALYIQDEHQQPRDMFFKTEKATDPVVAARFYLIAAKQIMHSSVKLSQDIPRLNMLTDLIDNYYLANK